ncbi:phosphatidylethanolamine/phosphatidyl-N-methylethanolamine N-methyltransferase [Rhodoblastus acidophilus]|uniref:class I SAM-dependent methyltransferase n=1 Tax=Rhodoblastus acidophilus TaxID=1074 RepID=UPI00222538C6|nr:class I SAM-dependent methyltransferase [Rhodoblastus acidophilus]MCW2284948.1 phosphatidylethanolamine/phosphatidyl-N-methylethanolamine N-methyltransferase [Rhodoblastus acidophilus]MCW2333988.1 phosphatidylethanolamine/phosphatidyl-N-methylethanolamine N-methyltransferase [Rhodoblastus acidophilus]
MNQMPRDLAQIENAHVEEAYARWAPIYDLAFTAVMAPGRRAAVAAAQRLGGKVLDVGVGTGLELPMFDADVELVGVDLSEPMLRRAQDRIARDSLTRVKGLCVMDATRLAFADGTFDATVAPYVLTVVPDPQATMAELARVTRVGGEIVLVNHVGAEAGPIAWIERWMGKRSASLGWRPEFPWAILGDWIASRKDLKLVERRKIAPLGLFTLTRIEKLF